MSRMINRLCANGERGISGLETAIVLIAFVVVSSVFAFSALSTGLFATDQTKNTVGAGLSEARGTLGLRGSVIAEDTDADGDVDKVHFQVSNTAGGGPIDLSQGKTIIRYTRLVAVSDL
jgi:flagellin FlaB